MGTSRNINVYADIAAVLDAAIAAGGGVYECRHYAEAYRWRARAYHLRILLRELAQEITPPGMAAVTKYDHIYLTIDTKLPRDERTKVGIVFRKPTGVLRDKDGNEIVITQNHDAQRQLADDRLQAEMDELLGDLK
jgi:hypothetical protein